MAGYATTNEGGAAGRQEACWAGRFIFTMPIGSLINVERKKEIKRKK